MSVVVSDHAVARFRERLPGLCRNGPTDEAIRATILACLASGTVTVTTTSDGGDPIEHVRTREPFAIRAIVLVTPRGREVLTVLAGARTRGDRAGQKVRRAARKAAEASCARSS